MTVNEEIFDAVTRHQIYLQRFTRQEMVDVVDLLARSDQELVRKLRAELSRMGPRPSYTLKRLKRLRERLQDERHTVMLELRRRTKSRLIELAKSEAKFERGMLKTAFPVEEFIIPEIRAETLRTLVTENPFSGGENAARTLNGWFRSLEVDDQTRLLDAIRKGMAQNETIDDIVRRVSGTRAAGWTNGALGTTRRRATAIVRTAVKHVSERAREAVWQTQPDVFQALRWSSILDGRTTAICRSRDGKYTTLTRERRSGQFRSLGPRLPSKLPRLRPAGARPPAHPQCRSNMVPVMNAEAVADELPERITVRDTRTRRMREIDFRSKAKATVGERRWSQMTRSQRQARIRNVRKGWAIRNVGRAPAETTYAQWLRRQPRAFQDDVLGKTKGRLFRQGRLGMDKFVDRRGSELTLGELASQHPEAFTRAGLDPDDF